MFEGRRAEGTMRGRADEPAPKRPTPTRRNPDVPADEQAYEDGWYRSLSAWGRVATPDPPAEDDAPSDAEDERDETPATP
jgi:hypothetical protein